MLTKTLAWSVLVLTGCASTQPLILNPENPASPEASEAAIPPARSTLVLDEPSRRTRELIAARANPDRNAPDVEQKQQPGEHQHE
jgi:hypothetical protein